MKFKPILTRKIVAFFVAALIAVLFPPAALAQNVSLQVENVTVKELLKAIEVSSGYTFAYVESELDLDRKVSLKANDRSVAEIISEVLPSVKVEMKGKKIILVSVQTPEGKPASADRAQAATSVYKGIVKDGDGQPVIGATVFIKGTANGSVTGLDGDFSISSAMGSTLVVSCLGYVEQELVLGKAHALDVVLETSRQFIEESVVVGYGSMKKRDIIGAVESIDGKSISSRPNFNAVKSLQGQVPGLTLVFQDGKPSRNASMNIRGNINSIGSGGSALVLIDGVEGDMSSLNPADIESVSVLKDAASCAVYGARGSFGVVLVTTKSGEKGEKFSVNYSGSVSVYSPTVWKSYIMDSVEWVEATKIFLDAAKGAPQTGVSIFNQIFSYSPEWFERLKTLPAGSHYSLEKDKAGAYQIGSGLSENGYYDYYSPGTDWQSLIFRRYYPGQNHSLTINGGSKKVKTNISANYYGQKGVYNTEAEKFRKINVRARVSADIKPWWTIDNNLSFFMSNYRQPLVYSESQNWHRMQEHQAFPVIPVYNADGTYTNTAIFCGYASLQSGTAYIENRNVQTTEVVTNTFHILKDILDFKTKFSYQYSIDRSDTVQDTFFGYKGEGISVNAPSTEYRSLKQNFGESHYWTLDNYLEWNQTFGTNHRASAVVGANIEHQRRMGTWVQRNGLTDMSKPVFSLANGTGFSLANSNSYEWAYSGFFARINYSFKDRYLVQLAGRYDGSSKFPSNSRWGFFPSASLGWRISEEEFMESTKGWLENLKVRLSAGQLGNGNVDPYAYVSTMSLSKVGILINGGRPSATWAPGIIPEGLTWEKVRTYDVGVDADFFNNRLNFVGDYYIKETTDMYTVGPTLPSVLGNTSPKGNYADMRTRGWEVSLSWRDTFKIGSEPFSYNVKGMLWDARSFITAYNNVTNNLNDYYVGQEYGEIWGMHVQGLFKNEAEVMGHANQNNFFTNGTGFQAGDLKFEDKNKDGFINNGSNTLDDPGDMTVIGNYSPRYSFGLNMGASYYGFDLNVFFQGVGKRDWYPGDEAGYFWGKYSRSYGFLNKEQTGDNVWTPENRNLDAYWPRRVGNLARNGIVGDSNYNGTLTKVANDRYLQNAAYIRLKSITLGYSLPSKLLSRADISQVRFYLSGENLWTWSPMFKHTSNFDPEVLGGGDIDFNGYYGSTSGKAEGYSYPMMKSVTFGVNITF